MPGPIRAGMLAIAAVLAMAGAPAAPAGTTADADHPGSAWLERVRWVNHAPIRPQDLAGRVVVVEFWTFECINCQRTVPAMKRLEETFRGGPALILGIHSPEFERERERANVAAAIARLGLSFPVAQDNDFAAWRAFGNEYWPALYVLDRAGRVRARHAGELHVGTAEWDEFVRTIRDLAGSHS